MPEFILWIAVIIILSTSTGLLLSRDWRLSLALLALQYTGAFLLMLDHWPLTMAAAKLVTGWMAGATLGMTQSGMPRFAQSESAWPEGRPFRLFMAALVVISVLSLSSGIRAFLPGISFPAAFGGMVLIAMGLLQLGITVQPLRVTLGLLPVLSGFEVLYSSIENSLLVAGLLAVITLGLALVGAYLINAENAQEEEV